MDKYEYQRKLEQVTAFINKGNYIEAVREADEMEWKREKNTKILTLVAKAYEKCKRYNDAEELLLQAFRNSPMGRGVLFHLSGLSLKRGKYSDAEMYYNEFAKLAPSDPQRFVLQYRICLARNGSNDELIRILEQYEEEDFDERWGFRLAELYAANGQDEKCIDLCNKIQLWFGEGPYVIEAIKLKGQFCEESEADREKLEMLEAREAEIRKLNEQKAKKLKIEQEASNEQAHAFDEDSKHIEEAVSQMAATVEPDAGITGLQETKIEAEIVSEDTSETEELPGDMTETEILPESKTEENLPENFTEAVDADMIGTAMDGMNQDEEAADPDEELLKALINDDEVKSEGINTTDDKDILSDEMMGLAETFDLSDDFTETEIPEEQEEILVNEFRHLPEDPVILDNIWHFMVYGDDQEVNIAYAIEILREMSTAKGNLPSTMVKATGEKINRIGVIDGIDRFLGKMVIVENAAKLNDERLKEFSRALDVDDCSLLVVFIGTKDELQNILERVPELEIPFSAIFKGKTYTEEDLVQYAHEFAEKMGGCISDGAEAIVKEKAHELIRKNQGDFKKDIETFISGALDMAEKKKFGLTELISRKYDKDGYVILKEKHFAR